jgi:hypothetical protein
VQSPEFKHQYQEKRKMKDRRLFAIWEKKKKRKILYAEIIPTNTVKMWLS